MLKSHYYDFLRRKNSGKIIIQLINCIIAGILFNYSLIHSATEIISSKKMPWKNVLTLQAKHQDVG